MNRLDQPKKARDRALRFTPEVDLLAELDDRLYFLARFEADLADGDFTDGDERQLHGGISFERFHIEQIVIELEARERAHARGISILGECNDGELLARFAAVRMIDAADIIRALTGQPGRRSGERWRFACPFHSDEVPSLTAYPGEKGWYCFSCQRGGDAVRFVMEWLGIGAIAALRLLESGVVDAQVPA